MKLFSWGYSTAVRGARLLLPMVAVGDGKLARGVRGRRGVLKRMAAWAAANRDTGRPLVWLHAASVGEGLQALAVAAVLRERRPDIQLVYTFFSPSAEGLGARADVDFADYLPFDDARDTRRAVELLRPDVIAFSKYDVWPNLVASAAREGVRVALLSATLPASSSRLRAPIRRLLRGTYSRLDAVAAISAEDASRFERLGVPTARRTVMGDARFDQVARRASAPPPELVEQLRNDRLPTLVAGSTWDADEERLLAAWKEVGRGARLILVPHEPTETHLAATERRIAALGLSSRRLSQGHPYEQDRVLLVDRTGILGALYSIADVAYVGGGWGSAGIHSVLEPAAYGIPVLFGPRHANAREAGELAERGGAFAVDSSAELLSRIRSLLEDEDKKNRAGEAARRYVEEGIGAAERGGAVIESLLEPGGR